MGQYDDIINLEHPTSKRHPRMAAIDRAAQFAPFAALTGYDDVIEETGRRTGERVDLDETSLEGLNTALGEIIGRLSDHPSVTVTHFVKDAVKQGGEYVTETCRVRDFDPVMRALVLTDDRTVLLEDILDLSI